MANKKVASEENNKKSTKISKEKGSSKEVKVTKSEKKVTSKKTKAPIKSSSAKTETKSKSKSTTSAKKIVITKVSKRKILKATSFKVVSVKNGSIKKIIALKKDSILKKTSSKTRKPRVKKSTTAKQMLAEYYDLPYRYNQTIVRILAQTPTTLFVYWDISDEDRANLVNQYGADFFNESIPILIVHNLTNNYSFEIEINDFANSWYIRTQEANCDYVIELGRKIISRPNEYIYIYSSNDIVSPNDHILFENTNLGNVIFRNAKTGILSSKDFGSLRFINDMDKLYGNLYDIYSRLYKDELFNVIGNPSSGEFLR